MSQLTLSNVAGDSVTIPLEIAKKLFNKLKAMDAIILSAKAQGTEECQEVGPEDTSTTLFLSQEEEPLCMSGLNVSKEVLEVLVNYAMLPDEERTANIPIPLTRPYAEYVKPHELDLVKRAEEKNYLTKLLDLATILRFEQLVAVCAAYANERIRDIARESPDIMAGAVRIREFLSISHSWTSEETEHLSEEMALAKKIDPHVY